MTTKHGDLSSTLEKRLNEQIKKAKDGRSKNKVASRALETFDKAYKSHHKPGKVISGVENKSV